MILPPAAHPDARLLVVDDAPANLHLLSRILTTAGCRQQLQHTDRLEVIGPVTSGSPSTPTIC